jgi:transposase-like protein
MAKRIIDQVLKTAALEELRAGVTQSEVAKKYGIAESTVSRWKKAAGIDGVPYAGAAVRSKPLKVGEDSSEASDEASSADRKKMIDKMISLVTGLAQDGGLKSHDVKNLSMASKALNEASAALEREEQARSTVIGLSTSSAKRSGQGQGQGKYKLSLTDEQGQPTNLALVFGALDYEQAVEEGDGEKATQVAERLLAECDEAGIAPQDVDWASVHDWQDPYEGYDSSVGER